MHNTTKIWFPRLQKIGISQFEAKNHWINFKLESILKINIPQKWFHNYFFFESRLTIKDDFTRSIYSINWRVGYLCSHLSWIIRGYTFLEVEFYQIRQKDEALIRFRITVWWEKICYAVGMDIETRVNRCYCNQIDINFLPIKQTSWSNGDYWIWLQNISSVNLYALK